MKKILSLAFWTPILLLAIALGVCASPDAAAAASGPTTRVSVSSSGAQGWDWSGTPSISADGRYVAFSSLTTGTVPGDTNLSWDIFVRSRDTSTTTCVSVNPSGKPGNNGSGTSPSISADGRYVAFESFATDLVAGDTNDRADVFVRDRVTGSTTRVSVSSSGAQGHEWSGTPSISSDGRFVAFASDASNLVAGDVNAVRDVFVRELATGVTTRVSVSDGASAAEGNDWSGTPSISGDGNHVAFSSNASNLATGTTNSLADVFVRDRAAQTTTRVSVGLAGAPSDGESTFPAISADGQDVAFCSAAANLVAADTNAEWDVFVFSRDTGITTRVSVDSSGVQGDLGSGYRPSISADGRFVAFCSDAANLVPGNLADAPDIFLRDRLVGVTTLVSVDSAGTPGNGESLNPAISGDGIHVAFDSDATNLVSGDTNASTDVFVNEMQRLASVVSITTGSASSLGYGAAFEVTGTLTSAGLPLSGHLVVMQSRVPGASYSDTSNTATTTADGTFSFSVRPTTKTYYRIRFAGTLEYAPSASTRSTYAVPRVSLGVPHAPSTMSHLKYYTVYGYLKPKHTLGSAVRIYRYRYVSGRWKRASGYLTTKSSVAGSWTKFSRSIRLSSTGKWKLRAYAPADSGHAATWSAYEYVTVR